MAAAVPDIGRKPEWVAAVPVPHLAHEILADILQLMASYGPRFCDRHDP